MARSSHGWRRATTRAVAHKPRPIPRIVRLGRAANDNLRRGVPWLRALAVAIAAALVMYALYDRGLI